MVMAFIGLHGAELLPNMCRDHITTEDLLCFLPPEKAANALSVLDIDGDGKISLTDMRDAVVSIYKERTNLASTLKARPCSGSLGSTSRRHLSVLGVDGNVEIFMTDMISIVVSVYKTRRHLTFTLKGHHCCHCHTHFANYKLQGTLSEQEL